ncbi:GCN5-related N-acetyltransferase 1, chloroplastic [Aristolochia californica]|uniref:GCN5-related N-acetyltransferase 1, chloroplastic n=1 Tax=Aristolochia californica TaxID=171875 RepID=UPI0035DD0174
MQFHGTAAVYATSSSLPTFKSPPTPTTRLRRPASRQVLSMVSQSPNPNPKFSFSDDVLASRGFNLHRSATGLDLDHLNSIFVAVGFPRRDPEKIRVALDHTPSLLWIEHTKTQKPVAFARATGDGVFNAIIWDVVVDPSYQGIGLGKVIMERLVAELLQKGITNIALYSEPKVLGFYRPLGFATDPDGIRGMVYSRKQKKKN